jgi:hypothetical protein
MTPDWGLPERRQRCILPRELKAWQNKISREGRASGKGRGFFVVHKHTAAQGFFCYSSCG